MTSKVTASEAPHRFEPSARGTRMVDTITFRAPLGRYMPHLIRQRNAFLAEQARGH